MKLIFCAFVLAFTFSSYAATKQFKIAPAGALIRPDMQTLTTLPLEGSNSAIVCDDVHSDTHENFLMLEGVRYNVVYPVGCEIFQRDTSKMETVVTLDMDAKTVVAYDAPFFLRFVNRYVYSGLTFYISKDAKGLKITHQESCGNIWHNGGSSGGCAELRTPQFLDVTFTEVGFDGLGDLYMELQGQRIRLQKNNFTDTYFYSGFVLGQLQDKLYDKWVFEQSKYATENRQTIMQIRFEDLSCAKPSYDNGYFLECYLGVTAYSCAKGQCDDSGEPK